ncbi:ABC transporter permease [Fusibacter ferrireducens]|uniref:ABC transporter permease n=1 Tax=Fusibacter ferrireducens TaxID=2785058 RepID=A0ABR9ZZ05_9FIRM|nr:ABC transporter permease [Fusibacter ferrireducens]MBF4695690.1 ABC transporter permease [Fusibacter ferrireducens]
MLRKISSSSYLVWSLLFIIIPIVMVGFLSFTPVEGSGHTGFSLENYKRFMEPIYLKVLLRSVEIAFKATFICFLVGYPMAMILAKMDNRIRNLAVMLFVVPMWMNFLLRTYAWMTILGKNGILNKFLSLFHVEPLTFLYSEGAVLLGMVYNFLPFMVLPIYTVLTKMDNNLIEAAEDLGGNKITVFRKIIFPLSLPGVVSGFSMVFMPAVSTFVITNLLSGGQYMLIGNLIEQQFLVVNDWHFGSAISMFLMVLILLTMSVMNRLGAGIGEEGSAGIW